MACIMLNLATQAALHCYERTIEKLVRTWPSAGHLSAQEDDMCRAEHPVRVRRSIAAKPGPPPGWDPAEPWSLVLQAVAGNDKFRDDQVSHPAAAWVAAGAKGVPMTPEERMATTHIPGGVAQITPMLEPPIKQTSENRKRKREERKRRRQSAVQE